MGQKNVVFSKPQESLQGSQAAGSGTWLPVVTCRGRTRSFGLLCGFLLSFDWLADTQRCVLQAEVNASGYCVGMYRTWGGKKQ